jgi:hypothetical protein
MVVALIVMRSGEELLELNIETEEASDPLKRGE